MSTTTTKTTCPTCGEGDVLPNGKPDHCNICGNMPNVLVSTCLGDVIVLRQTINNTVGRADSNTHQRLLALVSRHHCQVWYWNGFWHISDLGSTNGTWVNGARLAPNTPHVLQDGDDVSVGGIPYQFHGVSGDPLETF